jgi:hypothetical protein
MTKDCEPNGSKHSPNLVCLDPLNMAANYRKATNRHDILNGMLQCYNMNAINSTRISQNLLRFQETNTNRESDNAGGFCIGYVTMGKHRQRWLLRPLLRETKAEARFVDTDTSSVTYNAADVTALRNE